MSLVPELEWAAGLDLSRSWYPSPPAALAGDAAEAAAAADAEAQLQAALRAKAQPGGTYSLNVAVFSSTLLPALATTVALTFTETSAMRAVPGLAYSPAFEISPLVEALTRDMDARYGGDFTNQAYRGIPVQYYASVTTSISLAGLAAPATTTSNSVLALTAADVLAGTSGSGSTPSGSSVAVCDPVTYEVVPPAWMGLSGAFPGAVVLTDSMPESDPAFVVKLPAPPVTGETVKVDCTSAAVDDGRVALLTASFSITAATYSQPVPTKTAALRTAMGLSASASVDGLLPVAMRGLFSGLVPPSSAQLRKAQVVCRVSSSGGTEPRYALPQTLYVPLVLAVTRWPFFGDVLVEQGTTLRGEVQALVSSLSTLQTLAPVYTLTDRGIVLNATAALSDATTVPPIVPDVLLPLLPALGASGDALFTLNLDAQQLGWVIADFSRIDATSSSATTARRALAASAAVNVTALARTGARVGPFWSDTQVYMSGKRLQVLAVTADGLAMRVVLPSFADVCRPSASEPSGYACGDGKLTIVNPGQISLADLAALAANGEAAATVEARITTRGDAMGASLSCPPFCPGATSGLLPVATYCDPALTSTGTVQLSSAAAPSPTPGVSPVSPATVAYAPVEAVKATWFRPSLPRSFALAASTTLVSSTGTAGVSASSAFLNATVSQLVSQGVTIGVSSSASTSTGSTTGGSTTTTTSTTSSSNATKPTSSFEDAANLARPAVLFAPSCASAGFPATAGVCSLQTTNAGCGFVSGGTCKACPEGAYCPSTLTALPLPGYTALSASAGETTPCAEPATERCPGATLLSSSYCGRGYTGPECGGCADGWYETLESVGGVAAARCMPCSVAWASASSALITPAIKYAAVLLGILAAVAAVGAAISRKVGGTTAGAAKRSLQLTAACWLALQFTVQVARGATGVGGPLPSWVVSYLAFFPLLQFDAPVPAACRSAAGVSSAFSNLVAPCAAVLAVWGAVVLVTAALRAPAPQDASAVGAPPGWRSGPTAARLRKARDAGVIILCVLYALATNAAMEAVACEPARVTVAQYLSLHGDGAALAAAGVSCAGGNSACVAPSPTDPALKRVLDIEVSGHAPSYVCGEGAHAPVRALGAATLAVFTVIFPLVTLIAALLRLKAHATAARAASPSAAGGALRAPTPAALVAALHPLQWLRGVKRVAKCAPLSRATAADAAVPAPNSVTVENPLGGGVASERGLATTSAAPARLCDAVDADAAPASDAFCAGLFGFDLRPSAFYARHADFAAALALAAVAAFRDEEAGYGARFAPAIVFTIVLTVLQLATPGSQYGGMYAALAPVRLAALAVAFFLSLAGYAAGAAGAAGNTASSAGPALAALSVIAAFATLLLMGRALALGLVAGARAEEVALQRAAAARAAAAAKLALSTAGASSRRLSSTAPKLAPGLSIRFNAGDLAAPSGGLVASPSRRSVTAGFQVGAIPSPAEVKESPLRSTRALLKTGASTRTGLGAATSGGGASTSPRPLGAMGVSRRGGFGGSFDGGDPTNASPGVTSPLAFARSASSRGMMAAASTSSSSTPPSSAGARSAVPRTGGATTIYINPASPVDAPAGPEGPFKRRASAMYRGSNRVLLGPTQGHGGGATRTHAVPAPEPGQRSIFSPAASSRRVALGGGAGGSSGRMGGSRRNIAGSGAL